MSKRKRQRTRIVDKWTQKVMYNIIAPPEINSEGRIVGETFSDDPEKLIGRVIQVPLSDITGDHSRLYIKLHFQIVDVVGDTAKTRFRGWEYTRDHMRFLVRRRRSRIDAIINLTTSDGIPVRISATAFTTARAKTSQQHAIRVIMIDHLKKRAESTPFNQFIQDAALGKMSAEINESTRKVFPMKRIEIHKARILIPIEEARAALKNSPQS
ncbi:MAG: 30S ribosomal protein S3ae [Candidatus Hodarchaeota archaeon]